MNKAEVQLVECPRDAMQGIHEFIPTEKKIAYINTLLKCGFHTIDFGSFVSPKAIPQMKDTVEVLNKLEVDGSTKLLAIIANERGAQEAVQMEKIDYLGFPFSVSEEFQQRNTNSSIEESFARVAEIQQLCVKNNKKLVVYLSMGFGNPYGEPWSPELVIQWSNRLYKDLGINILALSDTIGVGTPELVSTLFAELIPAIPEVTFGAHLHTRPERAKDLIDAAFNAGCRRFDGAIKGFGGCPMAKDDLTGNMPTEKMLEWLDENKVNTGIDNKWFNTAMDQVMRVFPM